MSSRLELGNTSMEVPENRVALGAKSGGIISKEPKSLRELASLELLKKLGITERPVKERARLLYGREDLSDITKYNLLWFAYTEEELAEQKVDIYDAGFEYTIGVGNSRALAKIAVFSLGQRGIRSLIGEAAVAEKAAAEKAVAEKAVAEKAVAEKATDAVEKVVAAEKAAAERAVANKRITDLNSFYLYLHGKELDFLWEKISIREQSDIIDTELKNCGIEYNNRIEEVRQMHLELHSKESELSNATTQEERLLGVSSMIYGFLWPDYIRNLLDQARDNRIMANLGLRAVQVRLQDSCDALKDVDRRIMSIEAWKHKRQVMYGNGSGGEDDNI